VRRRRPLRGDARRLDLGEEQVRLVSAILTELRTAREQARLDSRRAAAAYASAFDAETFTPDDLASIGDARQKTAAKMHQHFLDALQKLHGVLSEKQRAALAMLLREAPPWLL